jgi:hypothetical protein
MAVGLQYWQCNSSGLNGEHDGNRYDQELERATRFRNRRARHLPVMSVIAPGLDFSALKVDIRTDDAWGSLGLVPNRSAGPSVNATHWNCLVRAGVCQRLSCPDSLVLHLAAL